jgi:hypothetical protein
MMDDSELRDLLREIPRDGAPSDFPARVMGRLDAVERRMRARRRMVPLLAGATAVAVAAGTAFLYRFEERRQEDAARVEQARLESLELEYRSIEHELAELQRMVAAAQPVVGIEGPGERGYLVDLGELAKARAEGSVPVAFELPH